MTANLTRSVNLFNKTIYLLELMEKLNIKTAQVVNYTKTMEFVMRTINAKTQTRG
jgi:hypothetical protein